MANRNTYFMHRGSTSSPSITFVIEEQPMFAALVRTLIGAAMEVHAHLGPGYLEPVYQEALALELTQRAVPFVREVHVPIHYKGQRLRFAYRADFVCAEQLVVELKAVQTLTDRDDAQLRSYLKATRLMHGLLINFGAERLQIKRSALSVPLPV